MSVGGESLERDRPGSTSVSSARCGCRGFGSSRAWWGNRWSGRGYGGSLFPCFWMRRKQWRRCWTFSDTRGVGKMRRAEVPCDREAGELDDEWAERACGCCLFCVCFPLPFLLGVWGAAVDALEAAQETTTGMLEGGFMLSAECTSRVIKFHSKQKPLLLPHGLGFNGTCLRLRSSIRTQCQPSRITSDWLKISCTTDGSSSLK
jgi:hypothetical protein